MSVISLSVSMTFCRVFFVNVSSLMPTVFTVTLHTGTMKDFSVIMVLVVCSYTLPSFSLDSNTLVVLSREDVTLSCSNISKTETQTDWFRMVNGTKATCISSMFDSSGPAYCTGFKSESFRMSSNITNVFLTISRVNSSDSGLYFCGFFLTSNIVLGATTYLKVQGFQSGFVTLPRLSRMDRQGPDGESCRGSIPRSDSLTSFTLDLGPSLMTEVLSFNDNRSCLEPSNQSEAPEEEEEEPEEDDLFDTPTQSPEVMSPNPCVSVYSRHMNSRGRCCGTDSQAQECGMEAEDFERAAAVLSRHYGGGFFTKRTRGSSSTSPVFNHNRSQASSEEEEEIKV